MRLDVPIKKMSAEVLVPMADVSALPYNQILNAEIRTIPDKRLRSYEQLSLYWVLCGYVAANTDDADCDTKEKVDEQVKIACKHYEFYTYYENAKTGERTLNIRTGSISFDKLAHLDACGYFNRAFPVMADKLGISVDELVGEAERRGEKLKVPEYQIKEATI